MKPRHSSPSAVHDTKPPRVLIFGAGSIGTLVTYLLSKSIPPSNIVAVCRSNYDTVATHGFTINSKIWGSNLKVQPVVVRSVDEAVERFPDGFDYVCITTKAVTTDLSQPNLIKPAVSPKTTIVLMQNGIGIEDPYATVFPDNAIISAVLYITCTQTVPGVCDHYLLTDMYLGTFPAAAPVSHKAATERLIQILQTGGASAVHEDDIQIARWRKLLINASENLICALSRLRDATFFRSSPGAVGFMKDVMLEIASIARSLGYSCIDDQVVEYQLGLLTSRELPGVEPSMMADVMANRRIEVDCVVGNAIQMTKKNNVAVPKLETLYYLAVGLDVSLSMK